MSAFVSTSVASEIIGCTPYSLVLEAKQARKEGHDTIGGVRFVFVGRILKLCKADLQAYEVPMYGDLLTLWDEVVRLRAERSPNGAGR